MNLQLHHVLSSITGLSGLAILYAILAGKRKPMELATLCHPRVKSRRETIAKALQADYRREHVFALKHPWMPTVTINARSPNWIRNWRPI